MLKKFKKKNEGMEETVELVLGVSGGGFHLLYLKPKE